MGSICLLKVLARNQRQQHLNVFEFEFEAFPPLILASATSDSTQKRLHDMKTKNRASRARVSKIPSTSPSVVSRVLSQVVNFNGEDRNVACIITSTERLDQSAAAKRPKVSANDDVSHDDTWVDEAENVNEPSIVPKTPSSSGGFHGHAPDSTGEVTIHKGSDGFLSSPDMLNWDCPATLEWTEQGICIKCNKGGEVLVCSNGDCCSLAVHEYCLGYSPSFDDMGNFYCPICSYKRALAECDKVEKEVALAKEKARSARDSFSVFINGRCQKQTTRSSELNKLAIAEDSNGIQREIRGSESSGALKDQQVAVDACGYINENSRVQTSLANKGDDASLISRDQAKEVGSSEQKTEDQRVAVSVAEFIDKCHASERNVVLRGVGSHSKQEDSPQNESVVDQQGVADVEFTNVNPGVETSPLSKRNGVSKFRGSHRKQIDHCQSNRAVESHQHDPVSGDSKNLYCIEDTDTSLLSQLFQAPKEKNNVETFQEPECIRDAEEQLSSEANVDFETCRGAATTVIHANFRTQDAAEHSKYIDTPEKSSSEPSMDLVETAGNQSLENVGSSKSMKHYKSAKHSSNPAIPNSRRNKLPWTYEEEQMLKEAVEKFSMDSRKNLSWRSILDFGSHVFNGSRMPVDLKDKWRNMIKDPSKGRKN